MKEGEGTKEGDQSLIVDTPNVNSSCLGGGCLEGRVVEWKKVEDILSQLGLQLIPNNYKSFTEGSASTVRRKKGFRELQNLKCNVNYERGGCSRGVQPSL